MSISYTKIPEVVVPGKRLGRHIVTDERSKNYPAELASTIKSVMHRASGLPLDQGNVGSCTAEALCGALNMVPHWIPGQPTLNQNNAYAIYGEETTLEGMPWPPNDPGGSGLEVCKAAKLMGFISSYQHTYTISGALSALVLRPVITGITWYTSFDNPNQHGLVEITPDATVRGGHEIVAAGIDNPNKLVWFVNSWGSNWGVPLPAAGVPGGCFCMSFSTWETLLSQGGDVTIPRTALGWHA